MENASEAINARVSHWIAELSRLLADLAPALEENNHASQDDVDSVTDGNRGAAAAAAYYEVRRDPEESWNDPDATHAGIEIRTRDGGEQPVLLGLSCASSVGGPHDADMDLLADYIMKDQTQLAEKGEPLGFFITSGVDEICVFNFTFTGYASREPDEFGKNISGPVHESESLRLGVDDEAIRVHLADAIARNRALEREEGQDDEEDEEGEEED